MDFGCAAVPCEPIPREYFLYKGRHLITLAFRQLASVLSPPLAAALSVRAVAVRSRRPADAAAETELERFPVAVAGADPAEAGLTTDAVESYIGAWCRIVSGSVDI